MRITRGQSIVGRPAIEIRQFLRKASGNNLGYQWSIKTAAVLLGVKEREAARIHRDLSREGYIEPSPSSRGHWGLTERGSALCMASAQPPIPRARAERMLKDFLARVKEVNTNPKFLFRVHRLGVFGSYVTGAPDLGDIDLAIQLSSKFSDDDERSEREERCRREAQRSGRRFPSFLDWTFWPEEEVRRFLRNRQRFSFHDWSEFERLIKKRHKHRVLLDETRRRR
jgi:predicted nucleotidyltransferase